MIFLCTFITCGENILAVSKNRISYQDFERIKTSNQKHIEIRKLISKCKKQVLTHWLKPAQN